MATKAELAKEYVALQRASKTDDMVAMLADDVEMIIPMQGTTTGKAAVEQAMRSRPGGGGAENLTWEEPTEHDGLIQMVATGGPFGPVRLILGFNADEKVNKIEIALGGASKENGQTMATNQFGFTPPPLNMSWAKVATERPPKPKDLGPAGFTLKMAVAGGPPRPFSALHDLQQARGLGRERGRPLRDRDSVALDPGHGDLVGLDRTDRRARRGVARSDLHDDLGNAVQLEPDADGVADGDLVRVSRSEALPLDAGVRAGAPR
jgi:hypothetical protein